MGALAPTVRWTPEDDLLLKNAVEAGASLESLAKGAVQFSRKFAIREVQDRWLSILYDPVIAEEASARMIDFEQSASGCPLKSNKIGNPAEEKYTTKRRNIQSVRRCYHAMRKRISNEPFHSMELGFLVAPSDNFGESIPNQYELQETDFDIMPEINFNQSNMCDYPDKPEENLLVDEMDRGKELPVTDNFDLIHTNRESLCSAFEENQVYNLSISDCEAPFHPLECSSPVNVWTMIEGMSAPHLADEDGEDADKNTGTSDPELKNEGYLAELSNTLLNFNEEELICMDVDGKEAIDKSFFDGLSSLLLNSPNEATQDHNMTEAELCHSEGQMHTSALISTPKILEQDYGVCSLNTEVPEIPNNDDIILPNQIHSPPLSSVTHHNIHEGNASTSSYEKDFKDNKRNSEKGPSLIKREPNNPGQSRVTSQVNLKDSGVKYQEKTDPSNPSAKAVRFGAVKEENIIETGLGKNLGYNYAGSSMESPFIGSDELRSYPGNSVSGGDQTNEAEDLIRDHQAFVETELGSTHLAGTEALLKDPLTSDPEEQLSESDDEVPYFSEIEAMVLDMDLDPDDQDLYSSREVSRYQHEHAKRAIIRLEQGACSYMQRAIAAHGAVAIVYGRHLKYYIKKLEVILGRATEEFDVDIDLRREGRANKISRRQAILRLDKDGCFYLQNLGKCSIFVNYREILPRQNLKLVSSCLIEVRGIPLIFEINQTCVKQYMDNILKERNAGII